VAEYALLRDHNMATGERWIYSAGFNVKPGAQNVERVSSEASDLRRLSLNGARVSILSHQGSAHDNTAKSLDFVAPILAQAVGRPVSYYPDSTSAGALRRSKAMLPGEIVIYGNTRHHSGEEMNDPDLARRLSLLGDFVAVGGFCKAHRQHASNVGLLRYRPGFLADSVLVEMAHLDQWRGRVDEFSVALLGGSKREKITKGLIGISSAYDLIVPGGSVLNTILWAMGISVGESVGHFEQELASKIRALLKGPRAKRILLPDAVQVARRVDDGWADVRVQPVASGVPDGMAIVDIVVNAELKRRLTQAAGRGRALLAGPLGLYGAGFRDSWRILKQSLEAHYPHAILLGGDTVNETGHSTFYRSTAGGAALEYISTGTTAVTSALSRQACLRFESAEESSDP
jgi:phosphoglycerate kinase